jgi:hypothetical protein
MESEVTRKVAIGLLWIVSLIICLVVGYAWGSASKSVLAGDTLTLNSTSPSVSPTATPVLSAPTNVPSTIFPTTVSPTLPVNSVACNKTGYAQKWEYLTPYVVKQGDSVENIANEQLHDETRVNEILQINGVGLVVGETIYLPPSNISKSSGNLKQVYGKLLEQNNTSWHIGFSSDPKGQGILIPSFWFEKLANKDTFKIGDCIKVFFDDGYTVYSVALQ